MVSVEAVELGGLVDVGDDEAECPQVTMAEYGDAVANQQRGADADTCLVDPLGPPAEMDDLTPAGSADVEQQREPRGR